MTNTLPLFHGSLTALITPMDSEGQLDFQALKNLVEYHVKAGTHGIIALGTTGEAPTLDAEEYTQFIQKVVEFSAGRIPIIAGTGCNCTKDAIRKTQLVEKLGVAGCLSVVPYYNKPTQEGLYQHFKAIAESTALPQILYNVPGRTGADLLPETVARLAKIENIVAIKEATGDIERVAKILALTDENFIILSGEDALGLESVRQGAKGVISVTNNIAAKEMAQLYEYALQKDFTRAEKINEQLKPLHRALFVESNPIPVKWAAKKLGLIPNGTLRLPLTELTQPAQEKVQKALEESGLMDNASK